MGRARIALGLLLFSALPLATELPAQIQGKWSRWEYFGMPCRDENGVLWFAKALDSPQTVPGVTLSMIPFNPVPPTTKLWVSVIGASPYSPGLLLPENPFLPGCRLFVAPLIALPDTFPDFTHPLPLAIRWPRNPALLNVSFYFQQFRMRLIEHQGRFLVNGTDAVKVTITAV